MAFKRAIVTAVGPLRILIDGDTVPVPFTPKSLIDPATLAVGDVVHADQSGHRLVVLGRSGGLGLVSGRNRLINSDFVVNQEGSVSGDIIPDNAYVLDGWKNTSGTATGIITWADSGGVRTLTIGNSGNSRNITQHVEQSSVPAGSYTLSWEGNALGTVYNDGDSQPTSADSPVTVALDGTANALIRFYGKSATVRNVKLELGTVATPYQPPAYDDNLRACQRFYYNPLLGITNADANIAQGTADSTTNARIIVPLAVPMRATPTLITSGSFGLYNGTTTTVTYMVLSGWTTSAVPVLYVVASGLTANRSYLFKRDNSASAKIAFDARL